MLEQILTNLFNIGPWVFFLTFFLEFGLIASDTDKTVRVSKTTKETQMICVLESKTFLCPESEVRLFAIGLYWRAFFKAETKDGRLWSLVRDQVESYTIRKKADSDLDLGKETHDVSCGKQWDY